MSRRLGVLVALVGFLAAAAVLAGTVLSGPEPVAAPPVPARAEAVAPPPAPVPAAEPPPAPAPSGQPPGTVRLPEGGTAELVRAEIDGSGTLPIPGGVTEATWWGSGLAASRGATVLAGHVNWKGATGPFAELWRSAPGQPVTVTDQTGAAHRYRIAQVLTVAKEELPTRAADLFGQGGQHRLVLVTCGGRYVGGGLGYDENRIVVAEPA